MANLVEDDNPEFNAGDIAFIEPNTHRSSEVLKPIHLHRAKLTLIRNPNMDAVAYPDLRRYPTALITPAEVLSNPILAHRRHLCSLGITLARVPLVDLLPFLAVKAADSALKMRTLGLYALEDLTVEVLEKALSYTLRACQGLN